MESGASESRKAFFVERISHCQPASNPINNGAGNGVCRPEKGKPPDRFSADNSCEAAWRIVPRLEHFMIAYLWVAFGGALGSVARFWFSGFIADRMGGTFPWGTLLVNVTGSFVIGFFATLTGPEGRWLAHSNTRIFFMTGICGGYTTFSSFSLQTLELVRGGEWLRAGVNCVGVRRALPDRRLARLRAGRGPQLNQRLLICKSPTKPFCCESSSAKATASSTTRSTKRSCSRRARRISPAPRSCAARWVSANPAACTPPKSCASPWTCPWSSKSWTARKKSAPSCPTLDGMLGGGLVTMEKVQVIDYRAGNSADKKE